MFSKKLIPLAIVAAATITISACKDDNDTESTSHSTHWSYSGETGPSHWYELEEAYSACEAGNTQTDVVSGELHQSPVDFNGTASLVTLGLNTTGALDFERTNNGHTIQLSEKSDTADATITINSVTYTLLQFHFHAGSEHTDHGQQAAMEVHFVFANTDDAEATKYAVVGAFIDQGETSNEELAKALAAPLPEEEVTDSSAIQIMVDQIISDQGNAYRYNGSFTTPPCTEGVEWTVLENHLTLTAEDIATFTEHYSDNFRPTTGTLN